MKIDFYESSMCCRIDLALNLADRFKQPTDCDLTPITFMAYQGLTSDDMADGLGGQVVPAKEATVILFVALAGYSVVGALTSLGVAR